MMADDEAVSGGSEGEVGKGNEVQKIKDGDFLIPLITSLPACVKRRVKALKKLQHQTVEIEAEFYAEVQQLECKYAELYAPIFGKRTAIVSGQHEPTEEECDWKDDDDDIADMSGHVESKMKLEDVDEKGNVTTTAASDLKPIADVSGIPDFWFTAFSNAELIAEMIQEYDVPILRHLQDVRVQLSTVESTTFTLEFAFAPNPYFSNSVLTKQYTMRTKPMAEDPLGYEGPEIVSCKGCTINWNQGKNVTVKVVKKVQKHKGRGTKRTVTQTVQRDSFFNFFSPPEVKEEEELDEDMEQLLALDFEIGHFIRERVIPRAVLYFTGDVNDNVGEFEDDDEGEIEDGSDEEEGDGSPGSSPPKLDQEKPECKQQ